MEKRCHPLKGNDKTANPNPFFTEEGPPESWHSTLPGILPLCGTACEASLRGSAKWLVREGLSAPKNWGVGKGLRILDNPSGDLLKVNLN